MAALDALLPVWAVRWRWGLVQQSLRRKLLERDDFDWAFPGEESAGATEARRPLRLVAGVDISFFVGPDALEDTRACVALVVCELDAAAGTAEVVWEDYAYVDMTEPYVAGYLAFREVPHHGALLRRLRRERPDLAPDVVLVDGNGVLHPRGFGCASHLGVVCDVCTVGVAKNLHLVDGLEASEVKRLVDGVAQGGHVPLVGGSGRVWGAALLPSPARPVAPKRAQVPPKNPIYVSVGHRISLESAVRAVGLCCLSARVPEPVRLADIRSRELVRQAKEDPSRLAHLRSPGAPPAAPARWLAGLAGLASLAALACRWAALRRRALPP